MGDRLPRVTAREISRVLEQRGFRLVRQSGSHMIYRDTTGLRTTIPFHGSKILHPKVLKSILTDSKLSVAQLQELL